MKHNLLSAFQFVKDNSCSLTLDSDGSLVKDRFAGKMLLRGTQLEMDPILCKALLHLKTRAQWSSSSQELRRQPQLQPQEISGEGRCSCTSLHLNRSASKSFGLQQWEPSAACVLQTAWRCCKREKLQKSPRLAKEGGLSATNHHAVSETRHK
ncbi:unnamed protein product [Prunus armeniaca]